MKGMEYFIVVARSGVQEEGAIVAFQQEGEWGKEGVGLGKLVSSDYLFLRGVVCGEC